MDRITQANLIFRAHHIARDIADLQIAIRKLESTEVSVSVIVDKGSRVNGYNWAARIEVCRKDMPHPLYGIRIYGRTARELWDRMEWYRDGIMCGLRAHWYVSATN